LGRRSQNAYFSGRPFLGSTSVYVSIAAMLLCLLLTMPCYHDATYVRAGDVPRGVLHRIVLGALLIARLDEV
jgi:hypothetical protein